MKVAVIGTGPNGSHHAQGLATMPGISVVGVADPATDKAEALVAETGGGAFADHRTMLEKAKPDAVWISSPCWLHAQHAVDCMEAGAHVMCEKPMALSLEDCDRMIATAEQTGKQLNIVQTTRYIPPIMEMKRQFDSGRCGELVTAASIRFGYHVAAPGRTWRLDGEKSGGIVFEWEIHEIDFCRYIGGEVSQVYARTAYSRPEAPTFLDHFTAVLTFANGGYGNLEASQSCHLPQSDRYFVGTRGTAKAAGANQVRIKTVDMGEAEVITVEDDGKSNQYRQDEDFVQALLDNRPPPVPGWDGRANVEIGLAIIESGRTGEIVNLPMGR